MKIDGLINIYKEKGYTSHDVVAKLRGILREKKIGHTGTLDPDATGVLPVCIGKATKVCDLITGYNKRYIAKGVLGINTDTYDISGKVIEKRDVTIGEKEFDDVLEVFSGEISQVPPMYSALKVNGKRLYEYAREGKEIERKPRKITIFECKKVDYDPVTHTFSIDVTCSKGTYIRSIIYDIGEKLGTGACMTELERVESGIFKAENALTVEEVEKVFKDGKINEILVGIEEVFSDYPALRVKEEAVVKLLNGGNISIKNVCFPDLKIENSIVCGINGKETNDTDSKEKSTKQNEKSGRIFRVYDESGKFRALYKYDEKKKMFILEKMFFND